MNNVAILNARNFIRDGGKFGNYVATSYELQGDRIILSCSCDGCGAKNKIPYSHVNVEARTPGTVRCVNIERHAPVAKAAEPDWISMDQAHFKKYVASLQSDVFLKMCRTNPAFAARNEETPNTYIDRKEAIERKDAEAIHTKREAQRTIFVNAHHAYEANGLNCPFNFEQWLQKSEAERQAVITPLDL